METVSRLTPAGVAYDLATSPFTVERHGLVFFFSSEKHADRFAHEIGARERMLDASMARRFKLKGDWALLASLQAYRQAETRGYYIARADGTESWHHAAEVELDGMSIKGRGSMKPSDVTMLP